MYDVDRSSHCPKKTRAASQEGLFSSQVRQAGEDLRKVLNERYEARGFLGFGMVWNEKLRRPQMGSYLGQALSIFWTPSLDACQKLCCNAVLEGFKHGLWPLLDTHPDRYAVLSVCSFGPLCRTGKTILILGCNSVAKTMVLWYTGQCQCDAWEHNFVYIFGTSTWRLHKAVQPLIPRRSMLVRTPCLRSSSCFQKVRDWKNSQMKTSTSADVITSAWATTISL